MTGSQILGLGHYAPARRVTNRELEARYGLEVGWIARRTGIETRHYAGSDQAVTDLGVSAAEMAIAQSGIARERIALTLFATSTPDHLLPPSAPLLAHRLGLRHAGALDVAGACSGFLYAMALADSFVRAHKVNVLIVAANILSRRINPDDLSSVALFGDAAGAALIGPSVRNSGVLGVHLAADGAQYNLIQISAGGSCQPYRPDMPREATLMKIVDGGAAFAQAVKMMIDTSRAALDKAGLESTDIRHWAPHQANARILEQVRPRLGIALENTLSTLGEYGNSSAATIPLTLSCKAAERTYRPGDKILLSAVGAGFIGGAMVWGM